MIKYFVALVISLLPMHLANAEVVELEDLAGRKVSINLPVSKFALSEGRYIATMAMLRPENPTEGLVGTMSPLRWTHPHLEYKIFEKHPEAKDIPAFGINGADSVSVEKIIALDPEVIVLGLSDHGPNSKAKELIDQLQAAGIKIVFIDFRLDPLNNTVPTLELLGKIFGAEDRAQAYIDFYEKRKSTIEDRIANVKERPSVFLQVHAGRRACCWGMADGMLGPFVELAGGTNIADKVAPGPTALHTLEFLLTENPDVWASTASGTVREFQTGGKPVTVGPGMDAEMVQKSLASYLAIEEFQAMDAIKNSRAHAFWHNFYNSPFNIVVLEALAKWIHPERFEDLDPNATLAGIYKQFMPFEIGGEYFVTYQHGTN